MTLWLGLAGTVYGQAPGPLVGPLPRPYAALPQGFEVNRGQADPRFAFLSHGPGYALLLAADQAEIRLVAPAIPPASGRAAALRVRLLGANRRARAEASDLQTGRSNYFIGNDPKKWRTNIPTYRRVTLKGVYPGIDLVYYGNQRQLEYDFVVAPGADPRAIVLDVGAVREPPQRAHPDAPLQIAADGDLVITTDAGELRLHKPVVYQPQSVVDSPRVTAKDHGPRTTDRAFNHQSSIALRPKAYGRRVVNRQSADGRFVLLASNQIGFEVANYNRKLPLIIDPVLSYSTYLGGSGTDGGNGIAVDADGNIYVGGATASTNFNGKALGRAFNTSDSPARAAFIAKISPSGALVFAAYIAGTNDQAYCAGLAIDKNRNVYLAGSTSADDFPTVNPIQSTFGGDHDAVVVEVSSSGDSLVYSTYLGGPQFDYAVGIQVDNKGNTYIMGSTQGGLPVLNAEQPTYGGGDVDAFAAKIAPGGSLLYCTYIGGSGTDYSNGAAIDSSGDLIAYGDTNSTDFPVKNAYQPQNNGYANGWFAKLGPQGALIDASYIGGSALEAVRGAQVDARGDLYLTGDTSSTDFPTLNPIQPNYGGGRRDAFIAELNPAWSALIFSTYWGGSEDDSGRGLEFDPVGNVYATGFTSSHNFPTVHPTQASNGGGYDAFLIKMQPGGSAVFFSTYLGGSGDDYAYGLAVDALGRAYLAGQTSGGFPTVDPLQSAYGGGSDDAFIAVVATCDFAFSPAHALFGLGGGKASVAIDTTPECGWTASSHESWIKLTSAASGVGSGSLSYSVAPDHNGSAHMGALTLGSPTFGTPRFSVRQSVFAPSVAVVPPSLPFAVHELNTTSSSRTVTLTNTGFAALGIASAALSGSNPADFGFKTTCPTLPNLVAARSHCSFTVTFTPMAVGPRQASITITDDAAGNPHQILLTGVGTAAKLVPPFVPFPPVTLGASSSPQTVTLTNVGTVTMDLSEIAITGTDAGEFSQTNTCTSTLAAGADCKFKVIFKPLAAGTRTASLTISDDGGGSPQAVPLTGTGRQP